MTRSWTVGGALRDELLGREVTDIDIAVDGDPEAAAREMGIEPGPELGRMLAELREAAYAGEIENREDAIEAARRLRHNSVS